MTAVDLTLPAAGSESPVTWDEALRTVLDDPAQPALVYQPIVDLARARVAGYECLARFSGPLQAPPDVWFQQAHLYGCAEEMEARVVRRALEERRHLEESRFLTVNITPTLLPSEPVRAAFASGGDLTGVVVELTEHVQYDSGDGLAAHLDALRAAGALIAMDDAGSGYAGLSQLLDVRPQLVKLDRALVEDIDTDAAKASMARLFGAITGSLDAWLLAEGIERVEELETCIALGIPLAQGYLLGRPAATFTELPDELAARILLAARRADDVTLVRAVLRTAPALAPGSAPAPSDGPQVVVDEYGCPTSLLLPLRRADDAPEHRAAAGMLLVRDDTPVHDAARRAMARPAANRLDPLVCVDDRGLLLGTVGIDDLTNALATLVERTLEGENRP
ncbi:EAL domain-containing protein (putative c-di-GMP-specific phosphodiesterase class I) [Motilibacter peucedani]|uniref:EAL domain-containing protein (Putative c-di-GMP-specific phosphodiesterase class I) n=1 Tax=Motilibacter peucedani TaxID=598650 RepID=A0A420XT97_9ACTN|nr:EAL domain-containing protein [Motilibacter peucedani]RKS80034.1 EAL domain-containing protein (putative c-di-GMP-specific phosphodiesterase class I) [Motilibacter peucedani]